MALLHHHRPDLVDVENLQDGDALVNCSKAFNIAEVNKETLIFFHYINSKFDFCFTQFLLLRKNLEFRPYWILRIWLLPPR